MESQTISLLRDSESEHRAAWIYTLLLVVFIVYVFAWVIYQVGLVSPRLTMEESFCCPEVVRQLDEQSNRSIDPCTNFLDYTCYGLRRRRVLRENVDIISRILIYPVFYGRMNNTAGRALHSYYTSCISTLVTERNIAEKALSAITDVCGIREALKPEGIIKAVVELPVRYGVISLIQVYLHESRGVNTLVLRVIPRGEEAFTGSIGYWREAFLALSSRLSMNVTFEETVDISMRLIRSSKRKSKATYGNSSILRNITRRVPFSEWQLVLARVNVWSDSLQISVGSMEAVEDVLNILTEPESSAAATAFLLMASTLSLAKSAMAAHLRAQIPQDVFRYCRLRTFFHYPLWEAAATLLLTNRARDAAVRTIFNTVFGAVNRSLFTAEQQCCPEGATTLISTFRLALPSDVNFVPPPKMTEYWKNELAARQYDKQIRREKSIRGIPLHWGYIENFRLDYSEGVIYVPPAVYAFLQFPDGVEPFINAAIIGTDMADTLWWAIFRQKGLNASVVQHLTAYENTSHGEKLSKLSYLHYPLLSLSTVSVAVRTITWHNLVDVLPAWQVSSSQAFYMIYFTYHMCQRILSWPNLTLEEARVMTSKYMKMLPDFNEAFRCSGRLPMDNTSCIECF